MCGHLHYRPDAVVNIEGGTISLSFSFLPADKLLALRRLAEGMTPQSCSSWEGASQTLVEELQRRIDKRLEPWVHSPRDFVIEVGLNGEAERVLAYLVKFFGLENITIERPSGVREGSRSVQQAMGAAAGHRRSWG